jgi:HK97 family phage major capsid protein
MDRLALASNGAVSQVFIDGIPQDRFLGYEVVLSDDMPSTTAVSQVCCIFGNFDRAVLLGERNEVRIAVSEHVAFQTDQTAVRATVRYDIAVHEEGDTSTAGAIVGLATHS